MKQRREPKLTERVTIDDLARTYDKTLGRRPAPVRIGPAVAAPAPRRPRGFTVTQGDVRLSRLKARADGIRFALQFENQTAAQAKVLRQVLHNLELAIRGMEMTARET